MINSVVHIGSSITEYGVQAKTALTGITLATNQIALVALALLALALTAAYFFYSKRIPKKPELDFTLGWNGQNITISSEKMERLNREYFEKFKMMTARANQLAKEKVLTQMEKDAHISQRVVAKFRHGDLEQLLGKGFANGSIALTEERIEYILAEARKLSAKDNLEKAYQTFKENLLRDIRQGNVGVHFWIQTSESRNKNKNLMEESTHLYINLPHLRL